MLENSEPLTVVDIRPEDERSEWYIPGSLHVDIYEKLQQGQVGALQELSLPGNRPIVTVCGAGKTSLQAADYLHKMGHEAYSLEGGMKAWSFAWNTAELPLPDCDTEVVQVRRTGKGCLSYIVANNGRAAVIDPSLPPEVYLKLAEARGWTIDAVLDTHVHADHLSRGRALAAMSDAGLYLPEQDRVSFEFNPLRHGDSLALGGLSLEVYHTPGHTPESMSYLLDEKAIFTGDTLFLTSVGRPDLGATPEIAQKKAHMLHRSVQKLISLDSSIYVLPGHVEQPVPFNGQPIFASIGTVREQTNLLDLPEREFVERITAHIPEAPLNHQTIVKLNEAGNTDMKDLTELEAGANRCAAT